jgi:hypothetical protein
MYQCEPQYCDLGSHATLKIESSNFLMVSNGLCHYLVVTYPQRTFKYTKNAVSIEEFVCLYFTNNWVQYSLGATSVYV